MSGSSGSGMTHLDEFDGVNELHAIRVVLLHAGGNRQDVGVKYDVIRVETHFLYQ